MIKIGFSMIFYPVAMGGYILSALKRRDDVEVTTVGPYTGTWIPWDGGMHLSPQYDNPPDTALAQTAIRMRPPFGLVTSRFDVDLDLFIQVDAGWHFADRPDADIVAHVQTDPHVLKEQYKLPKSYSDLNFCMQQPYMTDGEIYLPYAYDPTVHYPEHVAYKEYDACMVGLHYAQRDQLVNRLRSRNLQVYYSIGDVFGEYRTVYNRSRVALSWSSLQDLPARVWEGMAMKLPVVTNRVPDLQHFFEEGRDYLGFDAIEEAESQVMLLIEDNEKRKQIAEQGYQTVLPHTWDARVEQILKEAGLV